MRKNIRSQAHLVGLGLSLVLLVVVGIGSRLTWLEYESAAEATRTSRANINDLKRLLIYLGDAETAQRGFLLTGEERYLQPYIRAIPVIKAILPKLDRLASNDPVHPLPISPLRQSILDKLDELKTSIDLAKQGRAGEAVALVKTDRGRVTMERVRALESAAEEHQEAMLNITRQRTRDLANAAQLITTIGSTGIFFIVLGSAFWIRHLIMLDKRLNADLTRSLEDFQSLSDSVPQMVWRATESGTLEYVNQRWIDLSGLSPKLLASGGWQALLHPADRKTFLQQWDESLAQKTGFTAECRLKERTGGKYRWHLFRASPVMDGGFGCRWFATFTDIDEQKETEAALQRVNEDLQQFVYSASHDLQEPLRTMMIYSELVQRRAAGFKDQSGAEEIAFLRRAAERMSALVYDLLTYTQVAGSSLELHNPVDTNYVLLRVIDGFGALIESTGAQITRGTLPPLRIPDAHLRQLLQNLIGNAIKYRKEGTVPKIRIAATRDETNCVISVQDNGIGIEPTYHKQVFGLFKRLHTPDQYPGTGLGLAICKKVVERHHGHIWVESEVGVGSKFSFSLPCDVASP